MNAKQNFNDFALDVVLKEISQVMTGTNKDTCINISIACNVDDFVEVDKYVKILELLKQDKIIERLKHKTEAGYIKDEYGIDWEMTFYTPSFILNKNKLEKFLIDISKRPKYSLSMDEKRRLILNNKYVISTPHFDSVNYYFARYALEHPGDIITKESLIPTAGKFDKRFHTILEQINISPELRIIFFPGVSLAAAKFRNNVTVKELDGSNINERKFNRFLKMLQKI